jgi:threonine synthase
MSHRIVVAETWHNPDWDFARIVRNLSGRIRGNDDTEGVPSNWAWIAIRVAVLFGLFGELNRQGLTDIDQTVDIAVTAGDFSAPMAGLYAKQMGLPVGNIICSCNENGSLWDLLHHNELRTDVIAVHTNTPDCDIGTPYGVERLIYDRLGVQESLRFASLCKEGRVYTPNEADFGQLRKGLYAAVVSQKRMESVIYNVYRTNTYLLDPYSALAYGGLQDYRASVGEGRITLLVTERSPICSAATVAKAMGITVQELKDRISME